MPTRHDFLKAATAMAAAGVSIFQAEYRRVGPSPTIAQAEKLVGQGPTLQIRNQSYAQFRGLLSN